MRQENNMTKSEMANFSFLSFPKPYSKKNSYNPKRQASVTKPAVSSSSFLVQPNREEMRKVFDRYDANKDGKISLAEYRMAVRATSVTGHQDDVTSRKMFEVADKDGDGFIDFEEFVGVNAGARMAEIRSAFTVFDIDGDGRISAEELAEVLRRIGGFGECGVEACRRMVKGVDKDGDGLIDMDEFITMMTRTSTN